MDKGCAQRAQCGGDSAEWIVSRNGRRAIACGEHGPQFGDLQLRLCGPLKRCYAATAQFIDVSQPGLEKRLLKAR